MSEGGSGGGGGGGSSRGPSSIKPPTIKPPTIKPPTAQDAWGGTSLGGASSEIGSGAPPPASMMSPGMPSQATASAPRASKSKVWLWLIVCALLLFFLTAILAVALYLLLR